MWHILHVYILSTSWKCPSWYPCNVLPPMFVMHDVMMRWFKRHEFTLEHDLDVVQTYNKMHVGHRMQVEQGIVGLKWKWKRFMKSFDSTKDKYSHLFKIVVILTNFLHICHFNFTYEVISNPIDDPIDYNWDGDF